MSVIFKSVVLPYFNNQSPDSDDMSYFSISEIGQRDKYPQLVSNTSSGRGMRCDEAPIL